MEALPADHVGCLRCRRASHRREFALGMHELLSAGGREKNRERQFLPEERYPTIELRHIYKGSRFEANVFVRLVIPAEREFVRRGARDSGPGAVGDMLLGFGLEIEKR